MAIGLGVVLAVRAVADTLDWRSDDIRAHGYWPTSERVAALAPSVAFSFGYAALVLVSIPAQLYGLSEPRFEGLPALLEGGEGQGTDAQQIALANELREEGLKRRKRSRAAKKGAGGRR